MSDQKETQNVVQPPLPGSEVTPGVSPEITAILNQSGKQAEEVGKLVALNNQLQQKANDLSEKLNEARRRAREAEGQSQDIQEQLKEYQQLGKVDDLKATVQNTEQLQGEAEQLKEQNTQMQQQIEDMQQLSKQLNQMKREMTLRDIAETTGFKRRVLNTLVSDDMQFDFADTEDGQVVNIKVGEGEPVSLDEYAEKNWRDFLPALKPAQKTDGDNGVTYLKQPEEQPPSTAGDVLSTYLQQAIKARTSIPSPFSQKQQ